jgi:hypothetical protein
MLADGHDICYVVHVSGLERREVKLGKVTRDLAEVTAGLEEGEQIVLNPTGDDEAETETMLTGSEATPAGQVAHHADSPRVATASH